jgi:tight adherence protein C
VSPLLAALGALCLAAGAWEMAGSRGEAAAGAVRRRLRRRLRSESSAGGTMLIAGAERRIEAAALRGRLSPVALLAAKLAAAVLSVPLALTAAPVAPGRLSSLVAVGVPLAAFLAPDLLVEQVARTRRRRLAAALPDALDLMATAAASGRGPGALLAEGMRASSGPLREELAGAVAAIECGDSQEAALRRLRERSRGDRLGALAAALERSRRHGSPLSRALHEQASSLRADARREVAEHAARAAPKMQLVVALLLVPSVLLLVAAAIVANSTSILPTF